MDEARELDALRDLRGRVLMLAALAGWTKDAAHEEPHFPAPSVVFGMAPAFDANGCGPLYVPGPHAFMALIALARRAVRK